MEKVIPNHRSARITLRLLRDLIGDPECDFRYLLSGQKVNPFSDIVGLGYLVQTPEDYLFDIPGSAKVYAPMRAARSEIEKIVKRQPFKEILLSVRIDISSEFSDY